MKLFKLSIFFLSERASHGSGFQGICSFSLNCWICWHKGVHVLIIPLAQTSLLLFMILLICLFFFFPVQYGQGFLYFIDLLKESAFVVTDFSLFLFYFIGSHSDTISLFVLTLGFICSCFCFLRWMAEIIGLRSSSIVLATFHKF